MSLSLKNLLLKIINQAEFKTLLWTNPSSGSFSSQTISLSLSKYDAVEIWYYSTSTTDLLTPNPLRLKIGDSYINRGVAMVFHNLGGSGVNENTGVRMSTVSSTGVSFGDYYYKNRRSGGTQTMANQFCVPYKIFGVKFAG